MFISIELEKQQRQEYLNSLSDSNRGDAEVATVDFVDYLLVEGVLGLSKVQVNSQRGESFLFSCANIALDNAGKDMVHVKDTTTIENEFGEEEETNVYYESTQLLLTAKLPQGYQVKKLVFSRSSIEYYMAEVLDGAIPKTKADVKAFCSWIKNNILEFDYTEIHREEDVLYYLSHKEASASPIEDETEEVSLADLKKSAKKPAETVKKTVKTAEDYQIALAEAGIIPRLADAYLNAAKNQGITDYTELIAEIE